ncbi:unnamed protein product, partial [Mesorhabditis belari]|uniref:Neurotransmitter-gated ion-channel transmembrane domain-containing protein n=1 Tax=Mesorhabditis belari TaxID=2138241 RepID=A0AAF3EBP4_9BILA
MVENENQEMLLGDFMIIKWEWLLTGAFLSNGTIRHIDNESFSMIILNVQLKRQSFYYVFNLVFPTTLVSLVAVIGFHAPINATGRRESKFRLGIMTLLSMSVMLLMLVGEMKFAMESVPGQRGSFSDVPLLGIYYMTLILIVGVATCTTSIFVHLEKYAMRNPTVQAVPSCLRFLMAKKLFFCYVPKNFRFYPKGDDISRNNNVSAFSRHSTPENTLMRNLIPKEVNFTEVNQDQPITSEVLLDGPAQSRQRLDIIIQLIREIIQMKESMRSRGSLTGSYERPHLL